VWDLETGALLATLEGHAKGVTACAVTLDGRRVISALQDETFKAWDVMTGGPGMGKSALVAAWLARREAAGAVPSAAPLSGSTLRRDRGPLGGWRSSRRAAGS
jgi:WD40 repeat protein